MSDAKAALLVEISFNRILRNVLKRYFLDWGGYLNKCLISYGGFLPAQLYITKSPHRVGRNGSCKKMESTLSFINKFESVLVMLESPNVSHADDERLCVLC